MELLTNSEVRKTNHSKINEVDFGNLEFDKYVTDHMLKGSQTNYTRFQTTKFIYNG